MQDVEVQIGDAAAQMSHRRLAPDSRRPSVPEIKIDVVGAEESGPYRMQEFYPPSPITPDSGNQPSEGLINRLDGASN